MKSVVLATFNPHKLKEFRKLAKGMGIRILSLASFPDIKSPREHGRTFEANAIQKACEIARCTGLPALADDSGICVDALGGRPGVYSARYAGPGRNDLDNCHKLLSQLRRFSRRERTAHYFCSIALATPDHFVGVVNGKVSGRIMNEFRGHRGFGYDPIFYYPPYRKTFAQVPLEIKNKVSHRARALKKALKLLERI